MDYFEEKYFPTVEQTSALLEKLAALVPSAESRCFVSKRSVLQQLQQAGITGLTLYRDTYAGKPYEALARFM